MTCRLPSVASRLLIFIVRFIGRSMPRLGGPRASPVGYLPILERGPLDRSVHARGV